MVAIAFVNSLVLFFVLLIWLRSRSENEIIQKALQPTLFSILPGLLGAVIGLIYLNGFYPSELSFFVGWLAGVLAFFGLMIFYAFHPNLLKGILILVLSGGLLAWKAPDLSYRLHFFLRGEPETAEVVGYSSPRYKYGFGPSGVHIQTHDGIAIHESLFIGLDDCQGDRCPVLVDRTKREGRHGHISFLLRDIAVAMLAVLIGEVGVLWISMGNKGVKWPEPLFHLRRHRDKFPFSLWAVLIFWTAPMVPILAGLSLLASAF